MIELEAFILSGGKSKRMGRDKGLVLVKNKPMIQYALDILISMELNITIVANNNDYNKFGFKVITDIYKEKGPLGGIHTALKNSKKKNNLILGCDMPNISREVIEKLCKEAKEGKINVIKNNKIIQPLVAIYPKNIMPKVVNNIENNKLKLKDFVIENDGNFIETNFDERDFANINDRLMIRG